MKLDFFILADYAFVDQGTGKLNISGGGITRVSFPLPARVQSMFLVARFFVEDEDFGRTRSLDIRVVTPDGTRLDSPSMGGLISGLERRSYPDEDQSFIGVIQIAQLEVAQAGRYSFELWLDDEFVHSIGLFVVADGSDTNGESSGGRRQG